METCGANTHENIYTHIRLCMYVRFQTLCPYGLGARKFGLLGDPICYVNTSGIVLVKSFKKFIKIYFYGTDIRCETQAVVVYNNNKLLPGYLVLKNNLFAPLSINSQQRTDSFCCIC
jgi:hypothetical protein